MSKSKTDKESRRKFLRGATAASTGAAVTALLPGTAVAAEESAVPKDARKKGYELSRHVLDYYRSAKI